MNYLNVEDISKSFGEVMLFEHLSFSIHKGQKIAFVAKNGTGKTTILNILTGRDTPDSGAVVCRKDIQMAFLSQDPDLNPELTIKASIFNSENPILKGIENYHKALQNPDDSKGYQKAFDEMDRLQAWDFENTYTQVLFKLKLNDLNQKVSALSGGQKKRLSLAITLLSKPDLLILDEPTNHLDLEMIEWLEDFFEKESITLFMVTHDRYFLERVCSNIIELDHGKIYSYKGNYSYYLEKKEERIQREAIETNKAKQLFKKELKWIRRQPKARTTKSKSRVDDFQDIKQRAHQRRKDHEVQLEINMERLGTKILELHNVSKSYDDVLGKLSINNTKNLEEKILRSLVNSDLDETTQNVLLKQMEKKIFSKIKNGKLNGKTIKNLETELGRLERSYLPKGGFEGEIGIE